VTPTRAANRGRSAAGGWSAVADAATAPRRAYLVRGDDPSLVAEAVGELVSALVGHRAGIVVEEFGSSTDDLEPGAIVDALATPPLLADRRVIVVRDAGRLSAADAPRLVAALEQAGDDEHLVLAAGGGTVPAELSKAVDRLGTVVETSVGTGRARTQWVNDRLRAAPVRLDARASARLEEHLGGDLRRVGGLLETLASVYGPGSMIDEEQLEPFLGAAGSVPPWALTDAIDGGDSEEALVTLDRLLGPGESHPLVVLAVLHRHYATMLRLDGLPPTSAEEAAALIGARSVFPVKKAMERGARLGSARLGRAITLSAEADLDLRGRTALAGETVLQVLVARLTRLGGTPRAAGRRASATR
jgi:DNA polymerase III subunit delta